MVRKLHSSQIAATMVSSVFNGPPGPVGHDPTINARENALDSAKTVWPMVLVRLFQSLNNHVRVIEWKFSILSINLLAVSIRLSFSFQVLINFNSEYFLSIEHGGNITIFDTRRGKMNTLEGGIKGKCSTAFKTK